MGGGKAEGRDHTAGSETPNPRLVGLTKVSGGGGGGWGLSPLGQTWASPNTTTPFYLVSGNTSTEVMSRPSRHPPSWALQQLSGSLPTQEKLGTAGITLATLATRKSKPFTPTLQGKHCHRTNDFVLALRWNLIMKLCLLNKLV